MALDGTTERPVGRPDLGLVLGRVREAARAGAMPERHGRVTRATGTIVHAAMDDARVGDLCRLEDPRSDWSVEAEVVGLAEGQAILAPIGDLDGLSSHTRVVATGEPLSVAVGPGILGRVVDALGRPLDGRGPLRDCAERRPLTAAPPPAMRRRPIDRAMGLGVRSLDGLVTCAVGQRMGIYGEPGGGKSTLLAQIVRGGSADMFVLAMIGERGREVREFIEHNLGEAGLARSVVVVATSDASSIERSKAAFAATAIAEHFRDGGRDVILIMDSVTRFARAQREIGLAAGEPPARRGFPPSVFATLPRLMERAGQGERGSITALYAVLTEGDGTGDPIAEETRSILDGHIVLSAKLAARNHYPAVDVLESRSRVMNAVTGADHVAAAGRLRSLLAAHGEAEFLLRVGEYREGSDPLTDEAIAKIQDVRAFLQQGGDEPAPFDETVRRLVALAGVTTP